MYQDKPHVILIFNLMQDVSVLWPLALLIHQETGYPMRFLVTDNFVERDIGERWQDELAELEVRTGATIDRCGSALSAFNLLQDKRGVLIAASESSLNPHRLVHEIFRAAPADFVRITLQHGFECAGFRQNREQSIAFGENVRFAADIVCSWTGKERLTHTRPSDIGKVVVTGPTALIPVARAEGIDRTPDRTTGIVCENLHSTRMSASGDFRAGYMDTFLAFGKILAKKGRTVALRPHPGGQYVIRHDIALPDGMTLQNDPMYRLDLSQYAYGISAPSSVLLDMVLAGIPTAVWRDPDGLIDTDNYEGITQIGSLGEWLAFADAAIADPEPFLQRQQEFLARSGLITDAPSVRDNYLSLIRAACGNGPGSRPVRESKRVLFVANGEIPTLQICFLKPLATLFECGALDPLMIIEPQIRKNMGTAGKEAKAIAWFKAQIAEHKPDIAVFCRYSGPIAQAMMDMLHAAGVPVIYHIDDDLLNVPRQIGEAKYKEHNAPERLLSASIGLSDADLIYCSTEPLSQRLQQMGFQQPHRIARFYCAGDVLRQPLEGRVKKVGYMGFDHSHDLEMITPSLIRLLDKHQDIVFELFGTIPVPPELERFGDRVVSHLPVRPYDAFLRHMASLEWDIGLCPLADTGFNRYKANTKWVEYTATGSAVVATGGMAYDDCCSADCGVLVESPEDWFDALDALCSAPARRLKITQNAQRRLLDEYSISVQKIDTLNIFDMAQNLF